ncbi:hypothetical protein Ddye_028389 [Dipteronia dyeriana]|uniref:Expansin n=1 Tax=Dipteronia dyeriana TaxID=168575 RepID=A0AAD9TRT2_9ROSI|nr:hypothetical protein Ddye_028389 [Dipteronia dyeriana]
MTSESFAFSFLRKQYLTQLRKAHRGYVTSSIWSSFRSYYSDLLKECIWLICGNSQRDVLLTIGLGVPILELLGIVDYLASLMRVRVSDFIHEVFDADRLEIGCVCNYIDDLLILCWFDFRGRPVRAPVIKNVIWSSPASGWIKVNTNSAVLSSLGTGGCWGVFRNCRAFLKDCFAIHLGQVFVFEIKHLAASMTINFAWQNGWHQILLESDSSYVVQLLSSRSEQVVDTLSKHALGLYVDLCWANTHTFCSLLVGNAYFCPPNYGLLADYGGWCNFPKQHFEISKVAFAEIVEKKADIIPIQYRRVMCERRGGLRFTLSGSFHFYQVLVTNVGLDGEVIAVKMKG